MYLTGLAVGIADGPAARTSGGEASHAFSTGAESGVIGPCKGLSDGLEDGLYGTILTLGAER